MKGLLMLRLIGKKIKVIEVCVSPLGGRKGVYPHICSLVVYVRTDTKGCSKYQPNR